ncbi:LPXTG-motif cell wall anchor domain-containing protein [Clostridium amylolyticum]|uniref:LPXTG-motif cell wall anchor domain-containing protein n=1 Tax=Clostridium amylolyticum TaxID=1121298 RepID=A0A1M6ENR4_9CLOT|nr:5'-nucleotidase C-terminal domain-containing protein [Clostridium amylolyticum]SHI87039.1 LPXTG-motif cell wall anchor domain-containing protein [Clostridium amylolyticum]
MRKTYKKFLTLFTALMMIVSFITPVNLTAHAAETPIDIQILATSDMHNKFVAYDYATDSVSKSGSLAQIATLVKGLRAKNPNTILVDNGDTLQGTASSLFINDEIHPMIAGMNAMGYDSLSLGNHEFNYGMDFVARFKKAAKFEILCGNVLNTATKERLGKPYIIKEVNGVKVGIIGLITPHITKWDGPNLKGYTVTNPVDEGKKIADELRPQVDVMIATFHAGENEEYGNGDSARELAKAVPDLAAIVAGHAHSNIPQAKEGNVLITEPGSYAQKLSKIDLKVEKDASGKYKVASGSSTLIDVKDVAEDGSLVDILKSYDTRAKDNAKTVIGELKGGDLVPANEVKGIPQGVMQDTALIDLINKVQLEYGKKGVPAGARRVAGAAMFAENANVKEGSITNAGTSLIYKYDNSLMTLKVNGKQLKKYMEWSASYFNTFKTGDLTISFNEKIRLYNYDMFSGVKYDINISKAPGSRIENLTYSDGNSVKDEDTIYLTVNNYRANNTLLNNDSGLFKGEGVETIYDSTNEQPSQIRDFIGQYITEKKIITPEVDNNWKLTGYRWDSVKRDKAVKLINDGKLKLPTSEDGRTPNVKSINWEDILKVEKNFINILSFNDFHGTMEEAGKNIGAAKLAGEIKKFKEANPNSLVVAAGDLYQGSAMSNLLHGKPVSEFLKSIGLVTSAIGNHEFDWGWKYIPQWAKDGGFENFLASNIYSKDTGKPVDWAKAYIVKEVDGKKIGFIGLATPETAFKTKPENVKDFEFRDPVEAANTWAKHLKEVEKVDAVVALTHLGGFQDKSGKITGEAEDFANRVKNIDAIITGHTHQTLDGRVNNIPIVQGYYNGRSLARIHLEFDDNNKLVLAAGSVDDLYNRVKTLTEDPEVKAMVAGYVKELAPILNEKVIDLGMDLPHDTTQNGGLSPMGIWSTALMAKVGGAQIAVTNGGGLRRGFEKGTITMGLMYELMPFDNTIVTLNIKGADLKRVIEHGIMAEGFKPGQFYGLKVYYDKDAKANSRIKGMTLLDGTPIEMDKYYKVVTNDFIVDKGDQYDFTGAKDIVDTGKPIRDEMAALLKSMTAEELRALEAIASKPEEMMINGDVPVIEIPDVVVDKNVTTVNKLKGQNGNYEVAIDKIAEDTQVVIKDIQSLLNDPSGTLTIKGKDNSIFKIPFNAFEKGVLENADKIVITLDTDINSELLKGIKGVKTVFNYTIKVISKDGKETIIHKLANNASVEITIPLTSEMLKGLDLNKLAAFYYNEESKKFEFVSDVKVVDSTVTFKTNHLSTFAIAEKAVSSAGTVLPKTGEAIGFNFLVVLGISLAAVGTGLVVYKKKEEEDAV